MSRKRKELPSVEGLEITGVAAEGNAVARWGEMVVFVPYGAPGDVATVKIDRRKHSYCEGHIERLEKPSPVRVPPRCAYFGTCGGCRWQHLPYGEQLRFKQQQVADALRRIAKVELPEIRPIIGSDEQWEYRNKMEYTFSNRRWRSWEEMKGEEVRDNSSACGFHIPGAFDKVLDIDRCHLQCPLGNEVRNFVRDYGRDHSLDFYDLKAQRGFLRTLMVRTASTGESMAVLSVGEERPDDTFALLDAVRGAFPQLTSLMWVVNTKMNDTIADQEIRLHSGREYIEEEMEGLRFRVGPKSFYQTNSRQAHRLYSVVRDMAALTGGETVYDLYTGTGTIANFLARSAGRVIGIEYVPEAIADARVNSEANAIANTTFYAGDMKDVLTDGFIADHGGTPDVVVVDPPRAGMHPDVVQTILRAAPPVIVYVSCNPATQARDLALLDPLYRVEAVQPVDMFPHTQHVENVVRLTRRPR